MTPEEPTEAKPTTEYREPDLSFVPAWDPHISGEDFQHLADAAKDINETTGLMVELKGFKVGIPSRED